MASRATYTTNLNLVKPDVDDSYDITLSNDNMDKIDKAVGDLKTAMENIDLVDSKVQVEDKNNKFTGTTLDKVLDEIDDKIVDTNDKVDNIDMSANKVAYTDTHKLGATNVQQAVDKTVEKVKKLESERPRPVEETILASGWSGNKYSLEAKYPFAQYDIYIIDFADTVTKEQIYAWGDGMIRGSMTENVLTALDIVPTVDVPVKLELVKKGA